MVDSARRAAVEANASALRSAKTAEEATEIQRRILEIENQRRTESAIEAKRAKLSVSITRRRTPTLVGGGERDVDFLTIKNSGQATAHIREILVQEKPLAECEEFPKKLSEDASVGPGGSLDLLLLLRRPEPLMPEPLHMPFAVRVTWEDDSGILGEWTGSVS